MRTVKSYNLLLCLLCCVGMIESVNAEDALISEDEFFADIPPVDTVTRLPAPKSETPAAITVIDQDIIRASGVREIAELFRFVPGFQVTAIRGHRPVVTYHGFGDQYSRRLQILVDGRSVYDAMFGNVSWTSLPVAIDDIDRIEVVRGPNTAAYGANAFIGTINIVTKQSSSKLQKFEVGVATGNNDISDISASYSGEFAYGSYRVRAGYSQDRGLQEIPDGYDSRFANIRVDLQPDVANTLLLQTGVIQQDANEGEFNNLFSPPAESTVNAHFEQLRWQHKFSTANELTVQFYHNYRDYDFSYVTLPANLGPPIGIIQAPVSLDTKTERYDIEIENILNTVNNWRFVWGVGAREDTAESQPFFYTDKDLTTTSSRVFGNAEWRMTEKSILNFGGMWENTDLTETDFSPRIALNQHLSTNHTLRAAWSKAIRIPSLFEEHSDRRFYIGNVLFEHQFLSTGGLEPELMTSKEFGYYGRFPNLALTLDVRAFSENIDNFITEEIVSVSDVFDGVAFSFRNEGEVAIEGIEFELTYQPNDYFDLHLNFSSMDASGTDVPADTPRNQQNRLQSVPDYSGNLMLVYRPNSNWEAGFSYYKSAEILWLSDGDLLPAYDRFDFRIAYRKFIAGVSSEFAIVVQNAGDRYLDFADDRYFSRRVFATLKFTF